jgi:putative lipoprotein
MRHKADPRVWLCILALLTGCRSRAGPATSAWEEARRRGVDFRAVGNAPGWQLEIVDGESIVLVTGNGRDRYEAPAAAAKVDWQATRTIYRVGEGGRGLSILIEDLPCHDPVSGDSFEATVTVTLEGTEHRGCGRTLMPEDER